jgi:hypothetical protein
MTASSCVIVSENEHRPYAGSQISARGAVRAFEPPFRSQAPRCARASGGPANRLELANAALRDAKVREQISALDYDIRGGTAGEFAAFVSLDISRYKRLAEDMGLAEE